MMKLENVKNKTVKTRRRRRRGLVSTSEGRRMGREGWGSVHLRQGS